MDWSLVYMWLILSGIGIMSIFAASYRDGENVFQGFISLKTDYSRQLLWFTISGIFAVFILLTDSKFFTATANLWLCHWDRAVAAGLSLSFQCEGNPVHHPVW